MNTNMGFEITFNHTSKKKKIERERDNAKNSSKTETNANDERNDMITTDVLYI